METYREYFGLKEPPFSIAPDPRYLYMSDQHREALAHLVHGVNSDGGFVLLTGEVGTGKTTICRCLLEQIPENVNVAFVLNPKLTVEELLATICDELGIHYPEGTTSIKVFVDHINAYLLDAHAKGEKTVLILEEAQNLSIDVLEQIRLLTNLETTHCKLLQIIMLAQPEFKDTLLRPELRQLKQRITGRCHLGPLSRQEIEAYVNHRLGVAGVHRKLFHDSTMGKLSRLSGGIPRLINLICDRALLGAYVQGKNWVDKATLSKATREIFEDTRIRHKQGKMFRWVLVSLFILAFVSVLTIVYYNYQAQLLAIIAPKPAEQPVVPKPEIQHPQLSLLNWPEEQPIHLSKEMAYQSLFNQWGVIYKPNKGSICRQAQEYGLGCLDEKASLNSLLDLNRPTVLKLYDDQGQEFYATLIALGGQTATFVVGTETKTVAIREIEKSWFGEYILLWKMPPGYRGPIRPGQKGRVVQWLERQLSLIQGRNARLLKNPVFDDTMVRQVRKFQLAKGLVPDGIAGILTIIHLNTEVGSGEPVLIERQKDKKNVLYP